MHSRRSRDATARFAAEQTELMARAQWAEALADEVARLLPDLGAVERVVGDGVDASPRGVLQAVAEGREHLERVSADVGSLARGRPEPEVGEPTGTRDVRALIADVAEDLPPREAARCRAELPKATAAEITVLTDLADEGLTHEQLLHLLQGGHLLTPGYELIQGWAALDGVRPRTSSHYHPKVEPEPGPRWLERAAARFAAMKAKPVYGQQYGLKGPFVHEALFGPGPNEAMFVQLERAAPSKLRLAEHIGDWVEYRVTRRNQGPYGSTTETDAHPMQAPAPWRPDHGAAAVGEAERLAGDLDRIATEIATGAPFAIVVWQAPEAERFDAGLRATAEALTSAAQTLRVLSVPDG